MKAQSWTETVPLHHARRQKFGRHELRQERDWCLAEIEVARNGGFCDPHTPEEWITIMNRRVNILNELIREQS